MPKPYFKFRDVTAVNIGLKAFERRLQLVDSRCVQSRPAVPSISKGCQFHAVVKSLRQGYIEFSTGLTRRDGALTFCHAVPCRAYL